MGYIKSEVKKNYSAAQIFYAFHRMGTHSGLERLEEIGGSYLKSYILFSKTLQFIC